MTHLLQNNEILKLCNSHDTLIEFYSARFSRTEDKQFRLLTPENFIGACLSTKLVHPKQKHYIFKIKSDFRGSQYTSLHFNKGCFWLQGETFFEKPFTLSKIPQIVTPEVSSLLQSLYKSLIGDNLITIKFSYSTIAVAFAIAGARTPFILAKDYYGNVLNSLYKLNTGRIIANSHTSGDNVKFIKELSSIGKPQAILEQSVELLISEHLYKNTLLVEDYYKKLFEKRGY